MLFISNNMKEQLSARELLKLLKEAGKDNECIIELLVSMIQTNMQMGGSMTDSISYEVDKIRKKLYK